MVQNFFLQIGTWPHAGFWLQLPPVMDFNSCSSVMALKGLMSMVSFFSFELMVAPLVDAYGLVGD